MDWKEKVDIVVLRVAHVANQHDIIPELMFNADQTPSYFSPAASKTWELKGSKDVQVVGKTAKHSYTAMVTSTAAGNFLPIQVRSCPQAPSWRPSWTRPPPLGMVWPPCAAHGLHSRLL